MILRTVKLALKVAPTIIWAELSWLKRYAKHPEKYPIELRYNKARKLIRRVINKLELDVKFNNVDILNTQDKCFLGLSNHRHFIDPLFYIYYSEKPVSFVSKKENIKKPFVRDVMKAIDVLCIDREDVISQIRAFKTVAERIKKNELTYFIFPEGTRMKNREQLETLPFKEGALKVAYWAECDVVPCATYGSDYLLLKKRPNLKKRNITIEALKTIRYSDIKDKTTIQVMPLIHKDINEKLKDLYNQTLSRNLKKTKSLS